MTRTDALPKILPGAQSGAPSPVKNSFQPPTSMLEVRIIASGPSFSQRLPTMSKNRFLPSRCPPKDYSSFLDQSAQFLMTTALSSR
ncbi:MAG: hypothetical protein LKE92_03265 [Atopobiaceae bacterium]|nr:hypothetical protein [Atopobiaceae bacterium]